MPSPELISSYLSSLTDDIISQPMLKGEKSYENKNMEGGALKLQENSGYVKAKEHLKKKTMIKSLSECSKEIHAHGKYMAEALLVRGQGRR